MKKESKNKQYFLPGKVVFQIRHPAMATQDETNKVLLGALQGFLQSDTEYKNKGQQESSATGSKWKSRLQLSETNPRVITIPSENKEGQIFSLVSAQLPEHNDDDLSQEDVSEVILEAYEDLGKKPIPIRNDMAIQSLSPDWLASSLHHGPSTGGPGGWPYAANAPDGDGWKFEVNTPIDALLEFRNKLTGTDMHVAILDTAPSRQETDRAYHDYPNHPLVRALFGPTGKLNIKYSNQASMSQYMHFSPDSHAYWMADHGTFIAGIVHTLASNAKVDLYEVLSPYGTGSFESIAQGLVDVISDRGNAGYPLIINCSFMFSVPVNGTADPDRPLALRGVANSSLTMSMQEVFDWITQQPNVVLVAAAGNDANNNSSSSTRPEARFPASFNDVVGVGGLPKDFRKETDDATKYKPASYSNLSDAPPRTGFMTLGGEPGPDQGVLGVFISNFPVHNPSASEPGEVEYAVNPTGWARWAGTSFSAPIISGLLANLPSASGALPTRSTKASEKVIEVKQIVD